MDKVFCFFHMPFVYIIFENSALVCVMCVHFATLGSCVFVSPKGCPCVRMDGPENPRIILLGGEGMGGVMG